jgi:hypothetical protein
MSIIKVRGFLGSDLNEFPEEGPPHGVVIIISHEDRMRIENYTKVQFKKSIAAGRQIVMATSNKWMNGGSVICLKLKMLKKTTIHDAKGVRIPRASIMNRDVEVWITSKKYVIPTDDGDNIEGMFFNIMSVHLH